MGDPTVWAALSQKDALLAEFFDTAGFVDFVKYQSWTSHASWVKKYLVDHMPELCMQLTLCEVNVVSSLFYSNHTC
jgi:hypothetical protein